MTTASRSAKLQIVGIVGGAVSFLILFWGVFAMGGGHGTYVPWYAGLLVSTASAIFLVAGTIGAALQKEKGRRGVIFGTAAIVVFAVAALFFFDLIQWIADRIF